MDTDKKQNKLLLLSMWVGTGLSIALTMTMFIIFLCEICSDLSGIQPR